MSYQITITDAGRQALVNAENTGSAPLVISELAFGTGAYEPDGSETALQAETKRVNTLAGSAVGDGIIHLTVRDESNDSYSVNEFGLFTDTGVLFAVYAQIGDPIIIKSVSSALLLAIDMAFVDVDTASITFGDTNFSNPPATGTTPGIVRFQQHLMETSPFVAMRPGAFGLGGHMPIADANLAVLAGFYSCLAGTPNTPIADRAGVLIVAQGGEDTAGVHQTWCLSHGADQGLRYERHFSTSDGWSEWMETGGSNTITLDGPALIYPGTSNAYVITNYDSFSSYTAAISAGATATLVDELLTIDVALDTEPTDLTLTLSRNDKDREFAIEVGPVGIVTPVIESPIDGATDVIETSTVYSSPYATYPPDFDTHASSDWQIATDAAFTDVVFESLGDTENLGTLPIPPGALSYETSYYVRVKYNGDTPLYSDWSSAINITTRINPYASAEVATILEYDSVEYNRYSFGEVIAATPSASFIIIGGPDGGGDGYVYVFRYNGSNFVESQRLYESTRRGFGGSISISDDASVLAVADDVSYMRVRVYEKNAFNDFENVTGAGLENNLENPDVYRLAIGDTVFVSPDGNYIFARASYDGLGLAVYVYKKVNDVWTLIATLSPSDTDLINDFGYAITSNDDASIVAISGDSGAGGSIYFFTRTGDVFNEAQKLTSPNQSSNERFGYDISMSGNVLIAGAYYADGYKGAAYIVKFDGIEWVQYQRVQPDDIDASALFGRAVRISKDQTSAVISAPGADRAYVIADLNGVWVPVSLIDRGPYESVGGGVAINSDGSMALIGWDRYQGSRGIVYVYA